MAMSPSLFTIIWLLASAAYARTGTFSSLQTLSGQYMSAGRTFYYYKPQPYYAYKGIVMYLHGGGSNGFEAAFGGSDQQFLDLADRVGVLVMFPNGQEYPNQPSMHTWNDCMSGLSSCDDCFSGNDVQFIRDVTTWTQSNISPGPNTNRTYVMGESKGAQMAERLALEGNDFVAAVGVVAGNLPVGKDTDGNFVCRGYNFPYAQDSTRAVPIYLFKGDADPRIPFGDPIGPDRGTYCTISDKNQNPPCEKGAVHSYYDTLAFWDWKHGYSPASTIKGTAVATSTFNTVPTGSIAPGCSDPQTCNNAAACTNALQMFDGSYVIRRDIGQGNAIPRVVQNRAVGGGHGFPGPDVESCGSYNSSGWKNRDMLKYGYVVDDAWQFFLQFTLQD